MTYRIAVLADIHGNLSALEVVVEDIKKNKIDEVWVLGDYFFPGPASKDVLNLLEEIPVDLYLRGNWEDVYFRMIEGQVDWDNYFNVYASVLSEFISRNLEKKDIEFLQTLPIHQIVERKGIKFSLTHNAPNLSYGHDLLAQSPQANFEMLVVEDCDVAIYAHIHHPMMRYSFEDVLILNPGSVGQPFNRHQYEPHAQYMILELQENYIQEVRYRKIPFDIEKEMQRAKDKDLPFLDAYEILLKEGNAVTHNKEYLIPKQQEMGYDKNKDDIQKKMRQKFK